MASLGMHIEGVTVIPAIRNANLLAPARIFFGPQVSGEKLYTYSLRSQIDTLPPPPCSGILNIGGGGEGKVECEHC